MEIAVSATMLATTMLLSIAMREVWNWPLWKALTVGGVFGIVEGAFLSANLLKFTEGGWVPLLLGVLIYAVMRIWQMGIAAMQRQADKMQIPIDDIVAQITRGDVSRVSGTAIFVARVTRDIPPLVFWHLRHIRSLHDCIFIVTVVTELIPYVAEENRTEVREIAPQV
jgi:KUP system potassium uptake protein